MSIAGQITALQIDRTNIANAITTKGGTVNSGDGFDNFAADIMTIPSGGGGGGDEYLLHFYDFDGTLVQRYTASQIPLLSSLPAIPNHSTDTVPLTSDGWNWTLSQIQTYHTNYPTSYIEVGALYHTTDNKTHITFNIENDGFKYVEFGFYPESTPQQISGTVDWGDGTIENFTNTLVSHTYSSGGIYDCSFTTQSACFLDIGWKSIVLQEIKYCSITHIRLSSGVNTFGCNLLYNLEDISIPSTLAVFDVMSNCYQIKHLNAPGSSINIPTGGCSSLKSLSIGYGITSLSQKNVSGISPTRLLRHLTIPDTVTSINSAAFNALGLESIVVPNSVQSIGISDFSACYSLEDIYLSSNLIEIGNSAFLNCYSLKRVSIPSNVTEIGNNFFKYCFSLQTVNLPNLLTSIGVSAFEECNSLQSINIPNSVTEIGNSAFLNCYSLQTANIPDSITQLRNYTFSGCWALQTVNIPSNLITLGQAVFSGCRSLRNIDLPSTLTTIDSSAFRYCYSLQTIIIPQSVTSIGNYAFENCVSLSTMTLLPTTPPTIGSNTLSNTALSKIIVPQGTLSAYQSANYWSGYSSIMVEA